MTKILILSPSKTDSCSFYRAGGVFPALRRIADIDVVQFQFDQIIIHWQELIKYDIIMLQRPFDDSSLGICQYVKQIGIPLWLDYDDYLLGVPPDNNKALLYNAGVRENIKRMMRMADVISVTNEALKSALSEFNDNIKIIPNAFNDFIFKSRVKPLNRTKILLWRGSESHIYDIMSLGNELNKAADSFRDWYFYYMGYMPWYLTRTGGNVMHVEPMDVIHYFINGVKLAPSLIHVPLHDNQFNRCKSNIAYIEASYFGAPCLAPAWEAWKAPGVLSYNNSDEFYEHIKAICSGQDTIPMVKMAWDYIHEDLALSKINVKRIELINSLL